MGSLLINGIVLHKNPELFLFDKDGTLIDIHHYWASMIRVRASSIIQKWFDGHVDNKQIEVCLIDKMGVDLTTSRMKKDGPVGIKPRPFIVNVAADIVRSRGVPISNAEMETLFVDVDNETSKNLLPLLRLLPGVEQLLGQLKSCGIASIIVSTDITSRAKMAMESLGIAHYFSDIIGGDSVTNAKPAPDLANLAINKGSYCIKKTVVIGDHPVDIKMGKNAGVTTNIGVLTGLSEPSVFDELGCTVIQDLTAIEMRC